jgi:hypothetical protein
MRRELHVGIALKHRGAIAQGEVAVATGVIINKACGIPDSVVDADPRIISNFMTDIGFNSPAAVAVWSNNR